MTVLLRRTHGVFTRASSRLKPVPLTYRMHSVGPRAFGGTGFSREGIGCHTAK